MEMLPSSALSIPPIIFKSVDLPEPDGPRRTQNSPFAISRSRPRSTSTLLSPEPNDFLISLISKEILKLIETVNQKYGNTVVMVTHNDAIKDMEDRVVKLRDGMIRKNYQNEHKIPAMDLDW